MDFIQDILDIIAPILSIFLFPIILPLIIFHNIIKFISNSFFKKANLAGKVVLITGASSGIGEQLAYEYARKGARLVLVVRREERLFQVSEKARRLGSPEVLVACADVSKRKDCKECVAKAISHFGILDHLVNNAGIHNPVSTFEDITDFDSFMPMMNINFWGTIYLTRYAIPYLKKNKGKIIAVASSGAWLPIPGISMYSATKGAMISFYEVLRSEIGSDVQVTIVAPGLVNSEMTMAEEFIKKVNMVRSPVESAERCAKSIIRRACYGEKFVLEPAWMRTVYFWNQLCPELTQWIENWILQTQSWSSQSGSSSMNHGLKVE
ncbi:11-beta-hydroxysteroid dehydrogenase-like 4A [Impatiens glandulifera]|uniref:11-beta-hydroxysteroid dehydrogenase-like 4A n=1 Tax=Impatiens glandulifera TaxID=253017 RepID=UPI001FB06349|nr:11-beta-hydroxysteroid dehydrogenase-like 4A [Impatiens glandulifera]